MLIAALVGCGGTHPKTARLESTVGALESSSRRERDRMRELEGEIYTLKSRLNVAERPADVPVLPVEILEPGADNGGPGDAQHGAETSAETAGHAPGHEVASVDQDGVEVIYVGEAAKERYVRPHVPEYMRAAQGNPPPRASEPARAAAEPRITTPGADDRLPVTDDIGPTVERQLRQARRSIRELPGPVQAAPVPPPASRAQPGTRDPADGDIRAQYRRAYDALKAGDHASAVAGFRAFVQRHSGSDLADNARYWLGESFYDKRDYRAALTEFRKVVNDYPQGNKVPDALLKIGYCHIALGESTNARSVLAQLIEIYPRSNPAALAAERLATLGE